MIFISLLFFVSCKNNNFENSSNKAISSKEVFIQPTAHLNNKDIKTGKIEKSLIAESVICTGKIESQTDAVLTVSAPLGGFVNRLFYMPGQYVNKGDTLALLEHMNYISLQQDFLATKNQFEYLKEDFKRQGELTVENASSVKKMQQSQSDYRAIEVKLISLKKQLMLLGINPDNLSVENMHTTIYLKSPARGCITKISAGIGKYAACDEMIYEIINPDRLQLHMEVSGKDLFKVKPGQEITYCPLMNKSIKHHAVIKTVVRSINTETNSFSAYALIKPGSELYPGVEIQADITLYKDSVFAVPVDAILIKNHKKYILTVSDTVFTAIEIETGIGNSEFIEIKNFPDNLKESNIITSGVNLLL